MSRPLGSKNKPKPLKNLTRTIELNRNIENTALISDEGYNEWVTWGKKNDFPIQLLNLLHNSSTHSACVDFLTNAIIGKGVDLKDLGIDEEIVPNYLEDWNELLTKVAMDLVVFGGYAIQVIPNRGDGYTFYHQPFSTVRFAKKNEDGEITKAFLCKDWSNTNKYQPIEIDILNTTDDNITTAKGRAYLMVYTSYNPFDEYYPNPKYCSALDAIKADCELQKYDLSSVINNFTPSGVLTLNRIEDEQERNAILRNIQNMFSGSESAGRIIVSFKASDEDAPVEFTPFEASTKVNLFSDTALRNINRIVTAHRIASKTLIGINLEGNGFASEADVTEAAYNLTEKLTIANLRKKIVNTVNTIFKLNGIDQSINLDPLDFNLISVANINTTNNVDEENINKITDPTEEEEQIQ